MTATTDDPMYKIRTFLTTGVTKDNDATAAQVLTLIPEGGVESLAELFALYDVLVLVKPYATEYGRWIQGEPIEAEYLRAIETMCIDKDGITGVLMLNKIEKAIEADIEANSNATGTIDVRIVGRSDVTSQRVSGKNLWMCTYIVVYRTS